MLSFTSIFATCLLSLFSNIVSSDNRTTYIPDCECITGWNYRDLNCNTAITDGTIELLERYLTVDSIDCINSCDTNFECQQSLSLLSSYYEYCPLGTVSDEIIRSFWNSSSCSDCFMVKYNDANNPDCDVPDECDGDKAMIELAVEDMSQNCVDDNDTDTDVQQCSQFCSDSWETLSSYLRQCRSIFNNNDTYTLLTQLYQDESTDCIKDCNIVETYGFKGYQANCSSKVNGNYSTNLEIYKKLDLESLKQQTMLCFYGLNHTDPTVYDLICIERTKLDSVGILDYRETVSGTNEEYWAAFGFGYDLDHLWVLICGALVFFMQTGFTLLEAGTVKSGNVQNILFKNTMDACIGAIVFYTVGYCVAYGSESSPDANGFIGVEDILIESEDYNSWFFQWAFAATAATIVSGAVAERCSIEAYFLYTIAISAWIYPVVVHWVWSGTGWISPFNTKPEVFAGAIDFAGSAVVHMVGGFCGLCGAIWLGPRFRRFDRSSDAASSSKYLDALVHQFEFGHNVPFQVLGTLILWFGWYGFNAGSTLAANGAMELASKVAVTTTLAAAAGGLTCCGLARIFQHQWHIPRVCNGILAALVSITASCAVVSPGVAIVVGFIGGIVYYAASNLMERLEIDDPLDAFAVHGCGGMWGVLSAGMFGTDENVEFAGYSEALWKNTTHGERFATQLCLVIVVAVWTIANAGILFATMRYLGILRISEEMERSGIDIHEHGGSAVNMSRAYIKRHHDTKGEISPFNRLAIDTKEAEAGLGRTMIADESPAVYDETPKVDKGKNDVNQLEEIQEEEQEQEQTEDVSFPL